MFGALFAIVNNASNAAYVLQSGASAAKFAKTLIDQLRGEQKTDFHQFKASARVVDDLNDGVESEDRRWTREKLFIFVCAFLKFGNTGSLCWTRSPVEIAALILRNRKSPVIDEVRDRLLQEIVELGSVIEALHVQIGPQIGSGDTELQLNAQKVYTNPLEEWKRGVVLRIPAYTIDGFNMAQNAYHRLREAYKSRKENSAYLNQIRSLFAVLEDGGLSSSEAREALIDQGFETEAIANAMIR